MSVMARVYCPPFAGFDIAIATAEFAEPPTLFKVNVFDVERSTDVPAIVVGVETMAPATFNLALGAVVPIPTLPEPSMRIDSAQIVVDVVRPKTIAGVVIPAPVVETAAINACC